MRETEQKPDKDHKSKLELRSPKVLARNICVDANIVIYKLIFLGVNRPLLFMHPPQVVTRYALGC